MAFTQEQINEIMQKLQQNMSYVKDSQFPVATDLALTDWLPILQSGLNKIVPIQLLSDLIDVGIPDAPLNTNKYGRQNGNWVVINEGVAEAPNDNKIYGRFNSTWVEVTGGGGGGIAEAPLDGQDYVRSDASWKNMETEINNNPNIKARNPFDLTINVNGTPTVYNGSLARTVDITTGSGGIPEAPIDNQYYTRRNATWTSIVVPSVSTALPVALGTASAGTGTEYSRGNHVHPVFGLGQGLSWSGTAGSSNLQIPDAGVKYEMLENYIISQIRNGTVVERINNTVSYHEIILTDNKCVLIDTPTPITSLIFNPRNFSMFIGGVATIVLFNEDQVIITEETQPDRIFYIEESYGEKVGAPNESGTIRVITVSCVSSGEILGFAVNCARYKR